MVKRKKHARQSGVRAAAHKKVDAIMNKAESIRDRSMDEFDSFRDNTSAMKKGIDGYIRKNPEKAVLIAAAAGVVAGAILAATLRRKP